MKKIIILINSMGNGGAEKVVQLLISNLHKNGANIQLVCLEKDDKYKLDDTIKITYLNDNNKQSGIIKLLNLVPLSYKLYKYAKKEKIDIVQSHLFRANYINILSKIVFGSIHKVQVVNHTIISRYKNEGLLGFVNLKLIKILYPFSNTIISVSKIVEEDMQNLFEFKKEIKVIYNPFDINNIKNLSIEQVTDFKFCKDKKYIISVARLIKLKRSKDIIYALSKLDNNIELLFIGEGEERKELEKLSQYLKISNRIHFIGWVDNPYKYMKNSHILVSASETESFGNTIIEAMICGVPVISTKCGGPEEIIKNKIDGILIDIGDINKLVVSINYIINSSIKSEKYIEHGYIKIKQFNIYNIIQDYKNILEIK